MKQYLTILCLLSFLSLNSWGLQCSPTLPAKILQKLGKHSVAMQGKWTYSYNKQPASKANYFLKQVNLGEVKLRSEKMKPGVLCVYQDKQTREKIFAYRKGYYYVSSELKKHWQTSQNKQGLQCLPAKIKSNKPSHHQCHFKEVVHWP